MITDVLDLLLPALVERTLSDPAFAGLTVLSEDKSNAHTLLLQALSTGSATGGKVGAALVWKEPVLDELYENLPQGPMQINVSVLLLYEQVQAMNNANGIGLKPMALGRRLRRLKHFTLPGLATGLQLDKPFLRPTRFEFEGVKMPTLLAYEARYVCREADPDRLYTVPLPACSVAAGQAQLSCSDAEAAIYYTLDGSYPRAGNPAASLYSGAFDVTTGQTLQCCAYRPDDDQIIPSNLITQNL